MWFSNRMQGNKGFHFLLIDSTNIDCDWIPNTLPQSDTDNRNNEISKASDLYRLGCCQKLEIWMEYSGKGNI